MVCEGPSLTLIIGISVMRGGREVIRTAVATLLLEDTIDTGLTLEHLRQTIEARHPASLRLCTRLDRSVRRIVDLPLTFRGFGIPHRWVAGYGVDDQQRYGTPRPWEC